MFLDTRKVRKRQHMSNNICMDLGYKWLSSREEQEQERAGYTLYQMVAPKKTRKHEVLSLKPESKVAPRYQKLLISLCIRC